MIKSWTLKNFKSVKKLNKLDFAPLTIFAGANSSGKSTILQSILLTAQTLQNSVTTKSIILNGHISKFGTFNDILSNGANDRKITIGFELNPLLDAPNVEYYFPRYYLGRTELNNIKCEFIFSDLVNDIASELNQLQPKLENSKLTISRRNDVDEEIQIVRSKKTLEERVMELNLNEAFIQKNDLNTLEFEVKESTQRQDQRYLNRNISKHTAVHYAGTFLSHFLPRFLTAVYDNIEFETNKFLDMLANKERADNEEELYKKYINPDISKELKKINRETTREASSPVETLFPTNKHSLPFNFSNLKTLQARTSPSNRAFFQKVEERRTAIKKMIKTDVTTDNRLITLFNHYDYIDYIESFFKSNLKYLGPLRDEPKSVYPLSNSSDPKDVGFKGENTAAVLEANRNITIKYISPEFFSNSELSQMIDIPLMEAVLNWLSYLGIANKVDTVDKGKLGHELKISTPNSKSLHDLTHVGVGVSQVLPILVLSLLADGDSTLIFEQPELHLNPKVQTRLADFFFSMTLLNKQCIVETHSEYLINRLRYQVAINDNEQISNNVSIYFVEKEDDSSIYKNVKINRFGVIEDWPRGFFDENEDIASAILRAAMKKRKKEQEKL